MSLASLLWPVVATLVRWRVRRLNSVRRPWKRTMLLSMGIVVWPTPPRICRLAILVADRRRLLLLMRGVRGTMLSWNLVRWWWLRSRAI